ncbi:MAG: bis-aminopropyl spermidine synthase family protein [Candidatus Lokiarchaeota archaeon]|nr:bis-aminopropyl spermidine synthase family protein [Candidatus Harpocratesius repetitus]
MEFLFQLQEKVQIREGIEGHRLILREIYRAGHISLQDLAYQTKIPIPVLSKVINFLIDKEILDRIPEGILYTEKGMQFIERELHFYGYGISECDECDSLPIWISPRWEPLLEYLNEIFAKRPVVNTQLDQAFADAETSLQRALLLYRNGALEGKKICFLGDDDYTSIAVSELYRGFFPEEPHLIPNQIIVFDIDDRLLQDIKNQSKWDSPEFVTFHWDYRNPIPLKFLQQFDTVIVDPPYSISGLQLVISRAIELLNPNSGREIYLSFAHRSPEEMLQMQELFTKWGLVIAEIYPRFNYYEGAQIFGNITQLYRLVTTKQTLILKKASRKLNSLVAEDSQQVKNILKFVKADEIWTKPIYTGEISPSNRSYFCKSCKKSILVGVNSEISTIEELKLKGCPFCGSHGSFELEGKIYEENQKE